MYEQAAGPTDDGTGLGYAPQTPSSFDSLLTSTLCRLLPGALNVLPKVPGLLDTLQFSYFDKYLAYSMVDVDKGLLLSRDAPKPADGFRAVGVTRSALHNALIEAAIGAGVDIKWGHKLVTLQHEDDQVLLTFENGVQEYAGLVLACDGIHSRTRACLFGEEKAAFTGIVQVRLARFNVILMR